MNTSETKPTEEMWWEVTTTAGLTLQLPAPLKDTGAPLDPWTALAAAKSGGPRVHRSLSQSADTVYTVDLGEALVIATFTKKTDVNRMERSVARALGISSPSPSDDGPAAASPQDRSTSRSGPSTGGLLKRPRLH